jgi:hypothetical protein
VREEACIGGATTPQPWTLRLTRNAVVPLVWESNPKLQGGWCKPNHQPIGGSDPNHQGIWSPPRAGLSRTFASRDWGLKPISGLKPPIIGVGPQQDPCVSREPALTPFKGAFSNCLAVTLPFDFLYDVFSQIFAIFAILASFWPRPMRKERDRDF